MRRISLFKRLDRWYLSHERRLTSLALIGGFVVDNFTLDRIDLWFENLIIFSYILVAGLGIFVINLCENQVLTGRFFKGLSRWLPLFVQFAFGGLFSAFIIFYSRSASLTSSLLFVSVFAILLIGNEFFRKYYTRLGFQMTLFFVGVFSFMIFFLPVLFGKMGPWMFIFSGIVSLIFIKIFSSLLYVYVPGRVRRSRKTFWPSILVIFIVINTLYFTNFIPPIPLSLKDAGVYHNVEKISGGNYLTKKENRSLNDILHFKNTFHLLEYQPVYLYSSVFAPSKLNINIFHQWQYQNPSNNIWITADSMSFPIGGGRDGGYRGYSVKQNVFEGSWRVNIITEHDQLLGRVNFEVIKSNQSESLKFKEEIK